MRYEYDDPYSFLALYLISISPGPVISRMLVDDDFLFKMMLKELRNQDFNGPFLDCAITDILERKKRMEFMHQLDKVSEYLFSELDLDHLRDKIIEYATKYNILEL